MSLIAGRTRKRKASEEADPCPNLSLDELNQDLLEKILAWIPATNFFRLRSVCKRWSSVVASVTFRIACSQIRSRDPWFLMVDQDLDHSVIFDSTAGNWKILYEPRCFSKDQMIAVASSGGLVCFRGNSGELTVCNPLIRTFRKLPPSGETRPSLAIAISSSYHESTSSYKIVLVSGELPNLYYRIFDSVTSQWGDTVTLIRKAECSPETYIDDATYYINKSGDVVATNIERNPSKQFLAVLSFQAGEDIVYFLSHSGLVVACNLTRRTFREYPSLLPLSSEFSIDVVLCRKEMVVVLLSEFLETASLRLWRFCEIEWEWKLVAVVAPAISHELYGKNADINCVGHGDLIFVCINSNEVSRCVVYNMVADEWEELPDCFMDGKRKDFMSAFSFEPRLEASV